MATADQLREEYAKISEKNRKAYDALHGQFGTQNVARDYRIAVRDNNKEAIARLKPEFDRLTAEYKATQEEKNRKKTELDAAIKTESAEKTKAAKTKGASNVYQKALDELKNAEIDIHGYNGEKKYIDAYKAAAAAAKTLTDSGKPVALPDPIIPVPDLQAISGGASTGTDDGGTTKNLTVQDITNLITKTGNEDLLKKYQIALQPFGYKGNTQGKPDSSIVTALQRASESYGSIPGDWKTSAGNFQDWIFNPSIQGVSFQGTSGGTTGGLKSIPFKSSETDAANVIQQTIKSELGRDATALEITNLTKALNAYEAKNPRTTQGGYSTGSGVNQAEFIRQLITGQKNIKGLFNSKTDAQTVKDINQVIKGVTTEFTSKKGEAGKLAAQDLTGTLQANGLDKLVTQDQINAWTKRIQNGEKADTIKNEIRMLAKTGMPDNVKKLLDAGNDLSTIYHPYRQAMASILELDPNSISLNDQTLRSAIGPNGEMPLYDFQNALRKDPRWQYTNNAKTAVADSVTQVLKDFGFMG